MTKDIPLPICQFCGNTRSDLLRLVEIDVKDYRDPGGPTESYTLALCAPCLVAWNVLTPAREAELHRASLTDPRR